MTPHTRPSRVEILDTTLRDGLQNEGTVLATDEKIRLARRLADAGLRQLEVGSFVNPKKVPQMADTDQVVEGLLDLEDSGVELFALVFNARGAQRAADSGIRRVKLVISASEGHSRANADASIPEATDRLLSAVEVLKDNDIEFDLGTAVSFICPFDGITDPDHLISVIQPFVEAGARAIGVADTIGNANPSLVAGTVRRVQEAFPGYPLNLHLHDTYNFGMANVCAALDLGVSWFDAALGGLGGCPFAPGAAGNIGTDDLVHLLHREGVSTGVDSEKLAQIRPQLSAAVGHNLTSSLAEIPAVPAIDPAGEGADS